MRRLADVPSRKPAFRFLGFQPDQVFNMKPLSTSLTALAIASAFFQAGSALAEGPARGAATGTPMDLSAMSPAQKKQGQEYFGTHSFEFSSIFKNHHPGPYWILAKTKEFHLSSEQIKQQEALKFAMAKSTLSSSAVLQKAYEKYASDASATEPSLAVINDDIEAIGNAQTHLARVMVPYHLDAYAALRPAQQVLYQKLVAGEK